jgi:hypothetical protein
MRKIEYQLVNNFPKLAWVTMIDEEKDRLEVFHGQYVEQHMDWFIEGIWDGPFEKGGFHETDLVFGTGMRLDGDKIVFVSSSSMADRLYYLPHQKKLIVSNSLPCLMAFTDYDLDPIKDYTKFFQNLHKCNEKYERELSARGSREKIFNILGDNLVYLSGKAEVEIKPKKKHFSDFDSLNKFIDEAFLKFKNNWESPVRKHKMLTFSTISTGYDSAVVSLFASRAGCKCFFNCISSAAIGPGILRDKKKKCDDGGKIAEYMGANCIKFDRQDFQRNLSNEIYLFLGMPNTRLTNFLPMINYLDQLDCPSVLFTGIGGDYAWGSDPGDLGYDYGAISLSEIRLKAGFIHCAFLSWLSQFRDLLLDINRSEEMKRWSIRGFYDRPVPRRILEEGGIPGSEFGSVKKGAWNRLRVPMRPFDPQLRKSYYKFLTDNNLCSNWKIACFPVMSALFLSYWTLKITISFLLNKAGFKIHVNKTRPPFTRLAHSTFPWSVKLIADGYGIIMMK